MRGATALLVIFGLASCKPEHDEPPLLPAFAKPAEVRGQSPPVPALPATPWTFAVLSDLHLPNYTASKVSATVAALVEMQVRFVVITGDHTNGSARDGRRARASEWWQAVTTALQPLRDAGIGVLPVAGNHDTYLGWQREGYASAFSDLAEWARPLEINANPGRSVAHAPFSYSVDIDGVHLTLAHLVSAHIDPAVAAWIARDLEAAAGARHRIMVGHVPLSSVSQRPTRQFVAQLGAILERNHVAHYIAGHEHMSWDEDVALPGGGSLRQILVACSSGFYSFEPSADSKQRAGCVPIELAGKRDPLRCKMPNGGEFVLSRGRKNRHIQHYKQGFTLFTVDGDAIDVRPMTIDERGRAVTFYLDE